MLWFWFVAAIGLLAATGGWILIRVARALKAADHYSMGADLCYLMSGIAFVVAAVLVFVLGGTLVDRHVSEQACEKKDTYSTSSYTWVDYHYFSYECMLITPSGNITETPVLPIEDVGGDR